MAPLPKRKNSTARKGKRRSSIKLAVPALTPCPDCQKLKRPHHVCPSCGSYKQAKN
ncbi:MAG TPA: 50S ribosomal protein L32 [Candidatus Bathyarchaeia archaeon]|nr:50S ribosomal protein L32 [Candidatus Bathyarchaeia archaeon]